MRAWRERRKALPVAELPGVIIGFDLADGVLTWIAQVEGVSGDRFGFASDLGSVLFGQRITITITLDERPAPILGGQSADERDRDG